MKKLAALTLVCGLLCCSAFSCGSEDSSKASESSPASSETAAETEAEEKAAEGTTAPELAAETPTKPENVELDPEAEAELRAYVQAALTANPEETITHIYPESIYSAMIGTSAMSVFGDGGDSDSGLEDLSVTKCVKLSPSPYFSAAKSFYDETAETNKIDVVVPIMVSNAYDVEATIKASYCGSAETDVVPAVLVYIGSVGWKVIPMSANELLNVVK